MKNFLKKILSFLVSDKALHFLYSFLITVVLFKIFPNMFEGFIMVIVMSIGLLKEYVDKKYLNSYWSWWDILADFLGMFLGFIVMNLS